MLIEFQRRLLADRGRNELFAQALERYVRPGESVVLDIGAGTGFLSFVASKLGAKRCHLVEHSPVLSLSRKLARENRISNLEFHACHSTDLKSRIQADIIVSETLGNHALEEDVIETLNDARRFLKPGGVMIPGRLEHYVVPVVSEALWRDVNPWDDVGYGLSFDAAKQVGLQNLYVRSLDAQTCYSGPSAHVLWDRIDFREKNALRRVGKSEWSFEEASKIYGFALWWRIELAPDLWLSTSPLARSTHWGQVYLPIDRPLEAQSKDRLVLELQSESSYRRGFRQEWKYAHHRGTKLVHQSKFSSISGDLSR